MTSGAAKHFIDPDSKSLDPTFYKRMAMRCPFMMEVDLFNFPDSFIKERQINMWFVRTFPEMDGVVKEIIEKERMIVEKATLTKQVEQEHYNNAMTLFDVFKVVDRTRFRCL